MLSIIIPTLNEEKYLPWLLESIRKQNFQDYEVIVADAGSKDRTLEIAREYNCRVVPGGLPGKGKNEGAKVAEGDLLLFLDADAVLPDNFFEKALKEFQARKLKVATFFILPYDKNILSTLLFNLFYNLHIFLTEKILPHAAVSIIIEKELFRKINGFDETIKLAEDHDLSRRAAKLGKYGILESEKIFISVRRFKKDGWIRCYLKYLLCEIHMVLIGPVRSDIFNYKFGHYSKDNSV